MTFFYPTLNVLKCAQCGTCVCLRTTTTAALKQVRLEAGLCVTLHLLPELSEDYLYPCQKKLHTHHTKRGSVIIAPSSFFFDRDFKPARLTLRKDQKQVQWTIYSTERSSSSAIGPRTYGIGTVHTAMRRSSTKRDTKYEDSDEEVLELLRDLNVSHTLLLSLHHGRRCQVHCRRQRQVDPSVVS